MDSNEYWKSYLSFVLAVFGGAAGFGNLLRFPYLVFQNGGGAFLVPYLIFLIIIGSPLFVLELSYGVIFRKSIANAIPQLVNQKFYFTAMIPGMLSILTSFVTSVYFSVILTWNTLYLFQTFENPIPWSVSANPTANPVTATENFFNQRILRRSSQDYVVDDYSWDLALISLGIWIAALLGIIAGPNSIGRIVKVTIPLPLLMWGAIWARSLTQPGAASGMAFYIQPDFNVLAGYNTWVIAAGQILFSLAIVFIFYYF